MNYSNTKALGYKIAEAIYMKGPMASTELIAMFSDFAESSVKSQIGRMCFEADLENFAGKIQIRTHIRRHFAEKYADRSEVAAPRTVIVDRPLKNLPWAHHLEKLRDISFIGLSGNALN